MIKILKICSKSFMSGYKKDKFIYFIYFLGIYTKALSVINKLISAFKIRYTIFYTFIKATYILKTLSPRFGAIAINYFRQLNFAKFLVNKTIAVISLTYTNSFKINHIFISKCKKNSLINIIFILILTYNKIFLKN